MLLVQKRLLAKKMQITIASVCSTQKRLIHLVEFESSSPKAFPTKKKTKNIIYINKTSPKDYLCMRYDDK